MCSLKRISRVVAVALSALLVFTAPGLGVYEVLANGVASSVSAVKMNAPMSNLAPISLMGAAGLNAAAPMIGIGGMDLGLNSVLPSANTNTSISRKSAVSAQAVASASSLKVERGMGVVTAGAVAPVAPVTAVYDRPQDADKPWLKGKRRGKSQSPPLKSVGSGLRGTSLDVYAAIKNFGSISRANADSARTFGSRIQALLSGRKSFRANGTVSAGNVSGLRHFGEGFLSDVGEGFHARPAGGESIGAAVRAHNGDADTPAPPHKGDDGDFDGNDGGSSGHKAPLFARLFAGVVASLPGALIGLPLIAGGFTVAGSLVILASLGLVTMPFFGEGTGKALRVLPGVLVAGLGLWTLGAAVLGGSGLVMGLLVTLGGWGLIRFGRSKNKEYFDEEKVLTAFFGALAAVAGAGLVIVSPAALLAAWSAWLPFISASAWLGWAVTGATWLSYPLAAMLLMHLPGWVGEGIETIVRGIWESFRGVYRVLGSTKRDTILRDRLEQWSEAKLELSKWNIFKVGAVWIPVLIVEGVKAAVAFVSGVALGVVMAPTMFLWGAANSLAEKSRLNKFLASWNRFVFYQSQGSKKSIYNKLAAKIVPIANSDKALVSLVGAVGLLAVQAGWWIYAVAATPFLYVIGFFRAFAHTGGEYDYKKHSPSSIRGSQQGDSPFEKPDLPKKPVSDLIAPGIFATTLALLPLYFFGMPALSMPILGVSYLIAGLSFAALPLLPGKTPKLVRQLPGFLMVGLGIVTMAFVPYLTLGAVSLLTVLTSNVFWIGAVTALSGFGFIHNITKLADRGGKRWYSVDDPEYIGAFFGALGVLTGTGLAFAGVSGWLGIGLMAASYLSSILLLIHLPKWAWTGVGTAFSGAWRSMKGYHRLLNFWEESTKFYRNLKDQADYHLDGSLWSVIANATWLSLIWVPTWLIMAAEYVAAFVLGAATGLVRAPFNWAWGAAYKINPDSKLTRFLAGFVRSWFRDQEGFEAVPFGKTRIPGWMSANRPPSGRPTVGAYAAFVLARLLQAGALAAMTVFTPLILLRALVAGFRNASGVKDKSEDEDGWYDDKDDPDDLY